MNTNTSASWNSFRRVYWSIAAILALLLLFSWIAGFGPGGRACKIPGLSGKAAPAVSAPAPVVTPKPAAPAAAATTATAPAASSAVSKPAPAAAIAPPPAAKLYFALDKIALPQNTVAALLPVVEYLKANNGAKASISGFHDPTGKKARNEELALNRARAARGALERAGISRERIVMQKPQVTTGSGGAAEARRVEVVVQLP
jgi:K(+)-stimulated pyrophosphate-energized sodium pump